ncbi:MAG: FKBP-type peptidyl-prolyl cis-trans isomerase [Clostridia bacterium]|nr:FKBP-type peptidyl-prolyl cis-trans isomerase [Clostridia bacterium]
MDENQLIPGAEPEELEETVEETVEETENEFSEEIDEETAEILAEQDLLDGETEVEPADPLEVALDLATEGESITAEQAEEVRDRIKQTESALEKAQKTVKTWVIAAGCLLALLILTLSAVGALWVRLQDELPFAGLKMGKSYTNYITLPDYTTLTYTDTYVAPTDEDLQNEINAALKTAKKTTEETVTGALQDGDATVLDFEGFINGEKYDNACGTDQKLTLGSGTFIPGFEEGLVGKKVGEKVTLDLKFPDDYSTAELQGKAVKYEVTIKSATRTIYPKLTDALVKEITDEEHTKVDAYKQALFDELESTARSSAKDSAYQEIWSTIIQQSKLKKYPNNFYEYHYYSMSESDRSQYAAYGVLEDYLKSQMVYGYAVYTIAAKQGIEVTEEDYTKLLTANNCKTVEELAQKANIEVWELENSLLYGKVSEYLLEVSAVK